MLVVVCRPLASGTISERWRAHGRPHVVVIVQLTGLHFIDPIKTLIDILVVVTLALSNKNVRVIDSIGVVAKSESIKPIVPIA